MSKTFKPQIVSANDLFGGDVVYLDGNGNWTRKIAQAAVASSAKEADALLARADQPAKVVGPYLFDVVLGDGGIKPDHYRERFRETGPTFDAKYARAGYDELTTDYATTHSTQETT